MPTRHPYLFPGMDPWLEAPAWWPSVHHDLITAMAWDLSKRLAPRYVAKYGMREVVESVAERLITQDVTVTRKSSARKPTTRGEVADPAVTIELDKEEREEAFIEVRMSGPAGKLVTIVEILSPSNKTRGADGNEKYVKKQRETLASDVHLVEIDLLRGGEHTVFIPIERLRAHEPYDYVVTIGRARRRSRPQLYPVRLRDRLPRIPIPLSTGDPDAVTDLQALVERVYEAGAYWSLLDYRRPPTPALSPEDAAWATGLTRSGRRARGPR